MSFKSTRKKTGTNSFETITHNRRTGEIRRTQTVKLPDGTRSTSFSTKKPGMRITTTRKSGGYTERKSYSTVKKPRKQRSVSRGRRGSGMSFKKLLLIVFLIFLFFMFA